MSVPVFIDRSRIKSRQECPTYRYYHYHKPIQDSDQVGLQKPLPAHHFAIGLIVHKGLEILLKTGNVSEAIGKEVDALLLEYFPNDDQRKEMEWLCKGLIYGWYKDRFGTITRDYNIIATEQQYQWELHKTTDHTYLYNFRVDALLERKDDGRIAILDFKTAKKCDDEWVRMFEHDLQPMLYTRAIDELMGVDTIGMLFEGLVKGHNRVDTGKTSPFYRKAIQYSPLCYGYKTPTGFSPNFVRGSDKIQVWEYFSVEEWYDSFIAPAYDLEPIFVHIPPIKNSPAVIGNVLNSIVHAEVNYQDKLDYLSKISQDYPSLLNHYESIIIEKHTSHCFKYGSEYACPFYDLCWTQGVADDPLAHGYIPRVHNHSEEVSS